MEKEYLCRRVAFSKETFFTTSFKEWGLWNQKMDKAIRVIGMITKNMAQVSIYGPMVTLTEVTTRMESVRAME